VVRVLGPGWNDGSGAAGGRLAGERVRACSPRVVRCAGGAAGLAAGFSDDAYRSERCCGLWRWGCPESWSQAMWPSRAAPPCRKPMAAAAAFERLRSGSLLLGPARSLRQPCLIER